MEYHAGIDVSLEASSVCVVDAADREVDEAAVLGVRLARASTSS
jgi:hypothetical protein